MRRVLFLLWLGVCLHGQSLEEAVREIAKNILNPGETARVSEHSLSPESAAETGRARNLLERALRRPSPRDARVVEVIVTAAGNISGPLLVVRIQRGEEQTVETAPYVSQPATRVAKPSLQTTLIWEQMDPILDVAVEDDRMLVLSPARIQRLERHEGNWTPVESANLSAMFPSRDPRGKLVYSEELFTAFLSGGTCPGKWKPSLDLSCIDATSEFESDGEKIHFSRGRNILETADGEQLYSVARIGNIRLAASTDGKVHGTAIQGTPVSQNFVLA